MACRKRESPGTASIILLGVEASDNVDKFTQIADKLLMNQGVLRDSMLILMYEGAADTAPSQI